MADGRILLYCPTYDISGQEQIRPETKQCIAAIAARRPDVDVVISKNNPYVIGAYANVLHQYQVAEKMVREGGYRALFTVEHDMWLPEDALDRLDEVDAPVVYGLYLFRHTKPVVNAYRHVKSSNPDQSLSIFPDELRQAYKKGTVQVSGAGFGCTLIRSQVFYMVNFRQADGGNPIPDLPFAQDCMRLGIKQMCRMDVHCGHWHRGAWLWPGPGEVVMNTVKVLILQNFVAALGSTTQAMRAGEVVEIGEDVVHDYERAGFLQRVMEPAVKVVNKPPHKRKAVKTGDA